MSETNQYLNMNSKEFIENYKNIRSNTYAELQKTKGNINLDEFREYLTDLIISYKPKVYNDIADRVKGFPQCGSYTVAYFCDINIKYAQELSQFMKNQENINTLIKSIRSKDEYKGFDFLVKDVTDWPKVIDGSSTFIYPSAQLKINILFTVDLR